MGAPKKVKHKDFCEECMNENGYVPEDCACCGVNDQCIGENLMLDRFHKWINVAPIEKEISNSVINNIDDLSVNLIAHSIRNLLKSGN